MNEQTRTADAETVRRAGEPGLPAVEIRDVSKDYGSTPVLRSVDLDVPAGSVTAVLGSSGSGKTTLLRLIAGFDTADTGSIGIAGRLVDAGHRSVRAQHRGVGYVPQDAALFPHLTVAGNIGFGVRRSKRNGLSRLIELVGLTGYEHRYPHQLSGGQQQRVALARALAVRPTVVLLDEPFGSLDAALRESVRRDVIAILARTGTTTVLVTHDQDEALSVADHIALLDSGRVIAHGAPREIYEHPPTPRIAAAIGTANILPGHIDGDCVHCAFGVLPRAAPGYPESVAADGPCQLLLRPEHLQLSQVVRANAVPATVVNIRYHGHDTLIDLTTTPGETDDLPGGPLTARVTGAPAFRPGQPAWITTVAVPHIWA